ncbi:MAG: hypothetical protein IPM69_09125 [Ignavibacteria bacterium]|nr:hypothetical protein [Ignavibacteria bacterium]
MKHYLLLAIAFTLGITFAHELHAQGGSNYSIFGIGDLRHTLGASYEGLAGTQIAVWSDYTVNLANPAAWGAVKSTRIQGGFRFNQQSISNGQTTSSQNNGKLEGMAALFSIDTALGIGASMGFYPFSSVNYSLTTPTTITTGDGRTINGEIDATGKGGITAGYFGGSVRLTDNLSFGMSGLALFGTVSSVVQTLLYSSEAYSSINQANADFRGYGLKLGWMYSPIQNFTLGAAGSVYSELSGTKELRYSTIGTSELSSDTTFTSEFSTAMPSSFGLGASYQSGKFLFAADVELQDFSSFSYRSGRETFRSTLRTSFGISRVANFAPGTAFGDKIAFSLGGGYQQLYYNVNGTPINEYYGSFGMQIPLGNGAMLDGAALAGTRGTTTNGLVQELFGRFSVTISIGEIWFKPFPRD